MSVAPEETPRTSDQVAASSEAAGETPFWRRLLMRGKLQGAGESLHQVIATRWPVSAGKRVAGESVHEVIASRWPARAGNTIPLVTLAPQFRPEHHQVYLDLLERALRHPDTRSIALTGSYGSGKSSVLRALRRRWWNGRVITKLSLSTLDPKLAPVVQAGNPAESEMSNRIQKELVKQLLYQLPPWRTPRSRFPRASKPSWRSGVLVAATALVAVGLGWAVTTLEGWQQTIADRLDAVRWAAPWFWGGVSLGFVILALAAWWTLAGRYALQTGLKAGALTVSLEPTSSSYFDQYLDEIMYFFEVSKTNVVLIEDVDRFGDAVVFDTLRALNTLVNSSGQIRRRVVFVYAISDSVLGRIGANPKKKKGNKPSHDQPGDAPYASGRPALEIDRANRAKYFDVIIPIVPFVTTDNARDLMMEAMRPHVGDAPGTTGVTPALIRVVARHVADMRTISSIRNEFEVHVDRLITSAHKPMPEINKDIVLSLVLLRATSPDAYEKIRLRTSPLDDLTKRWLTLVDANLETQTKNLTDMRTQLENGETLESRAARAGQLLDSLRPELRAMARTLIAEQVEFSGPLADSKLTDLGGWQQIANGVSLTVDLVSKPDGYGRTRREEAALGSQMLARLLGMPIDPQTWQDADLDDLRRKIHTTEQEISFLRHHTWQALCERTDLTVAADPRFPAEAGEGTPQRDRVSFGDLVQAHAPTPLAGELVVHGYLPRHFARYSSMFYGGVVGLNAAEYISRAIEPGVPIFEYELDEQAVEQILVEQGASRDDADLFDDVSVYNLDIVGYLLKHRRGAAQRVAVHLAERWDDPEEKFVGRFFQRQDPQMSRTLAGLMTPAWKQALRYTAVDAQLAPETRLLLVNSVLGAIGADEQGELGVDVGEYLSEHYAELTALTGPPDESRATTVMRTIATAGGTIHDLTTLNPAALAAAAQVSVYPVTSTNLCALGGADRVALDVLRLEPGTRPIYDHSLDNLALYLDALTQIDPPGPPIKDPTNFGIVLNDIAATPRVPLLGQFIEATAAACRITDLKEVLPEAWPALVTLRRTDPTFENVQRYLIELGVDKALGGFLAGHTKMTTPATTPQPERLVVAAAILAAREAIPAPATRVALASSIAPGVIPITQLAPEDADLVGPLLAAKLLADEPNTFDPNLLTRWDHLEPAIAASEHFGEFSDATTMPARYLAQTLTSEAVHAETKATLIIKLASLLIQATPTDASAIAHALTQRHESLDLPRIQALRAAGASNPSLVRLLVTQGENISVADLRTILLAMEGDYGRLSTGGAGTVRFKLDQDHRTLLQRLVGVTHTGTKERYTMKYGTNLEANLKHPSP